MFPHVLAGSWEVLPELYCPLDDGLIGHFTFDNEVLNQMDSFEL